MFERDNVKLTSSTLSGQVFICGEKLLGWELRVED
jgi:hypothetical protein